MASLAGARRLRAAFISKSRTANASPDGSASGGKGHSQKTAGRCHAMKLERTGVVRIIWRREYKRLHRRNKVDSSRKRNARIVKSKG